MDSWICACTGLQVDPVNVHPANHEIPDERPLLGICRHDAPIGQIILVDRDSFYRASMTVLCNIFLTQRNHRGAAWTERWKGRNCSSRSVFTLQQYTPRYVHSRSDSIVTAWRS